MVSADMHVAANRPDIIFTSHINILIYLFIIITVSTSQAKTLHGGGFMQLQLINLILKLFSRGNFFDVIR